ncbi:hypothetical protein GQ53DRAFT_832492 [Thozetella sp. PMI_491]|nr:hypothetical protein GQ53DRAFT_832492 [Thozetella sp. PMI_491]
MPFLSEACSDYGILPDGFGLWALCHDNPDGTSGGFSYSVLDLRAGANSHALSVSSSNASSIAGRCEIPDNSSLVLCNSTIGGQAIVSGEQPQPLGHTSGFADLFIQAYSISFDTAGGGHLVCPNGAKSVIRQGAFQETCRNISLVSNTATCKATVLYAECAADLKRTQFKPSWLDLSSCIHWNPFELQFEISAVNGDSGLEWCGREAMDAGFHLAPRINSSPKSPFSDWFQTSCIAQLGGYTNASYHLGRLNNLNSKA